MRNKNAKDGEDGEIEVTVYDYFVNHRNIQLRYSGDLPCINVGKPKRPTYIPLEVNILPSSFYKYDMYSFLCCFVFIDFVVIAL